METKVKYLEYNKKENHYLINKGWGCGYVMIPENHPILILLEINKDNPYYNLQLPEFPEEITYSQWEGKYYVIGFDTAHLFNTPNDDEQYVKEQTAIIKKAVDNFTNVDAMLEIDTFLLEIKTRLLDKYDEITSE